ncbi:MAG: M3 family oligoendopeptidase [Anaerolineaceae bacterium]|nr:M3 family oligoendopeptidase [Anaerolineaceae bacterium]
MADVTIEKQATGAENVVWDLSVFYSGGDDPAIQRDMDALSADVETFAQKYRGRVAELSAAELAEAMHTQEELYDRRGRIGSFASLTYSTDTTNPAYGQLVQRVTEFGATLGQKMVFFDLEWNKVDAEKVKTLLEEPTLAKYRHYLEAERRYQPYQLTEPEEQILMDKSVTGSSAWGRFFTQLTSALKVDYDGEELTLSQVLPKLHDSDREVRRQANTAITAALQSRAMELTYVFNVLVADKASDDKRRGYPTWVSYRNLDNKAPDAVVDALIAAVTSHYEIVTRHYNLKRALLGLDELTEYDRYAPLPLKTGDRFYTWDEAKAMVLTAYQAFSPQFAEIAGRFFDENWIHAPVTPGKRGGAFCSSTVPSAHPYVLVNFTGTANDVMTLAHELGHGIHGYLASRAQGILGMYTPLTTAEMASTFGEMLVFTDLMGKEPDAETRLAMLAQKIEDTFATIFRQVSMNRFEDKLHNARRTEGELTTERVNTLWMETQRAMFGDSVNLSDAYSQWWSYVPHFVQVPGYVYAYAFGELLVLALFNVYQQRGTDFVPQFIDVLAAGDSDWPENILAKAGVDLTDLNFWNQGLAALRDLVEQEEQLAREVYPEKF